LIASHNAVKTPRVVDCFETGNYQVLLLDWINSGERTEEFWKKFGEQLAALHASTSEYFGLDHNNYMGSVPQSNEKQANWAQFFIEKRLQPLVDQCISRQLLFPEHRKNFEKLYLLLPEIFSEEQKPSLLHGDLWNGNFMCSQNSAPVLIDPAVYYGHPAVDLGMTTLFGGFSPAFYDAYNYHSPFPKNHKQQWQVCNLYPLLIHLLLFGRSYLSQIDFILEQCG
jgi:protein-ribulosamine 3-kinase